MRYLGTLVTLAGIATMVWHSVVLVNPTDLAGVGASAFWFSMGIAAALLGNVIDLRRQLRILERRQLDRVPESRAV